MAECHDIQLSKAAEKEQAKAQGGAQAAAGGPPTEAEIKKLEQYAENVLKPCLGKPPTPQESAKFAEERQFRDKKAEEEFLTRTLETARSNCYIYCEKRDLG
jgi:hypothetical protein